MPYSGSRILFSFFSILSLSISSSQAGATSSSLYPPSDLVFTLVRGVDANLNAPIIRAATLTCFPKIAGSHPFARNACKLLDGAQGSIADLAGKRHVCTAEYIPVTVTAEGVWQGQRIRYEETFENRCVLLSERGTVFDF